MEQVEKGGAEEKLSEMKRQLEKDGSYREQGEGEQYSSDFWSDAKRASITAVGGIDAGRGKFTADVDFQYKVAGGVIYARTLRYRMTQPPNRPNKYRANINFEAKSGSNRNRNTSPDTLWQDRQWHIYEALVSVPVGHPSVLEIGIEVDFDGQDGGGWFWTWKVYEL